MSPVGCPSLILNVMLLSTVYVKYLASLLLVCFDFGIMRVHFVSVGILIKYA